MSSGSRSGDLEGARRGREKGKAPAHCRGLSINTRAPVSRILYPPCDGPPSSIWDRAHARPLSTYPPGSSGPPLACPKTSAPAYLVFQLVGFTKLPRSHAALVGSYPTFSSLPPPCGGSAVSLSAALSMASPSPVIPLPVRKHDALCCPDFPPFPLRKRTTERCAGCQGTPDCLRRDQWCRISMAVAP